MKKIVRKNELKKMADEIKALKKRVTELEARPPIIIPPITIPPTPLYPCGDKYGGSNPIITPPFVVTAGTNTRTNNKQITIGNTGEHITC